MAPLSVHFAEFHRQNALTIFGRHADQRRNPHPENCARPANGNCGSNAANITSAHCRRKRRHQRGEGRNIAFLARVALACQLANGIGQFYDRHETKPHHQIKPGTQQQYQNWWILHRIRAPDIRVGQLNKALQIHYAVLD